MMCVWNPTSPDLMRRTGTENVGSHLFDEFAESSHYQPATDHKKVLARVSFPRRGRAPAGLGLFHESDAASRQALIRQPGAQVAA